MSGGMSARSTAQHDRVPSASFSRRGPAARTVMRERPTSSSEVAPDDSASNVSHRRVASGATKVNGGSKPFSERLTERTRITTKDVVQSRARSPVKSSFDSLGGGHGQDGQQLARPMTAPRREKKAPSRFPPTSNISIESDDC